MKKIKGNNDRLRLSVFRSNKFIYAQVIDDEKSHTIASAKGTDAKEVGAKIAEVLLEKSKRSLPLRGKKIVFDRRDYRYHGKIKILADAAREKGLEF